jgi:site-specific DNA recombinase
MAATTPPRARTGRSRRTRPRPGKDDAATDTGVRRVAIYARRSTDEEHQPFSIDAQISALRAYAASQPGWSVVFEFTDDASGATTDRPDLQRALTAAEAGRFDVLLVYRVDRFSRRLSIMLDLMHELDSHAVAFCSATESFDTSTAIGRMLVQLLGVFAEFERETIIDRVTKGMAAKATKGKWPGGRRPYGYIVDKDTQHLVPHDPEIATVKTIYHLYTSERLGTRAIATELNERGIRNATGNIWSGFTIARILDNPAYAGDLAYADVYVPDAHPPLIERDIFTRARQIADARADTHTQRAASPSDYCLTGLITCPTCGSKYIGTAAHGRTRAYRYYTCCSRSKYGAGGCKGARLNADATDDAVLQALADFYATADTLLTRVITTAQEQFHDAHTDRRAELDTITTQIHHTEAAIDRYHIAFEAGTMDDTTAGPRINELRHKITQLKTRHHDLTEALTAQPAPPPPGTLDFVRTHLRDLITNGSPGERKRAIEALIHEVRLTEEGSVIPVFKIPTSQTLLIPQNQREPMTMVIGSRNGAVGGPGRARTDDTRGVNAVLYQLSYRPQTQTNVPTPQTRQGKTTAPRAPPGNGPAAGPHPSG